MGQLRRVVGGALAAVCFAVVTFEASAARPTKAEINRAQRELFKLGARFSFDKKVADKIIAAAVPYETTDAQLKGMLKHFQKLPDLETLDFADSKELTDESFATMGKIASVRAIYLDRSQLTGAKFEDLKELPKLQLLSLRGCKKVDGANFLRLNDVKTLIALDLSDNSFDQKTLDQITKACPRLQIFRAAGNQFTCVHEDFADLANMRELELPGNSLGESALASLARFSGLTRLDVSGINEADGVAFHQTAGLNDAFTDFFGMLTGKIIPLGRSDSARIREVPSARGFYAKPKNFAAAGAKERSADRMTLESLDAKVHWGGLQSLDASFQSINDAGFSQLARLPMLEWLDVSGSPFKGEGTPAVIHWKSLKTLVAGFSGMTDEGLKQTLKAPVLERLEIYGVDAKMETEWAAAKKLKSVMVMHSGITDRGLEAMAMAPLIEEIDAPSTGLTCEGLSLSQFKKLRILNLNNTGTTDVGLKSLYVVRSLKDLYLHDSQVTEKGVNAIRAALPGCRVHWEKPRPPVKSNPLDIKIPSIGVGKSVNPVRAAGPLVQLPTPVKPIKAPPPTPRNPAGGAVVPKGTSGGTKP